MKRKIVYLATRFPLPPSGGRERMILQSLEILNELGDVHFVFFSRKKIADSEIKRLGVASWMRLGFPPLPLLAVNFFRFREKSLQEILFYSQRSKRIFNSIIDEIRPDIVVADMIRCGQYVEDLHCMKILEMDDMLSLRYLRFLTTTSKNDDLLGTFASILPKSVSTFINKWLKSSVLESEAKRIGKREKEIVGKFDAVTLVSPQEAALLRELTGSKNIFSVPLAIKEAKNLYNPPEQACRLLFIGNLTTNQNLASLTFIVREVLPLLEQKGESYTFKVVGVHDERALHLTGTDSRIILAGYVNSLEEVIAHATLLLSPIVFGSGIKIKILDALSFGLPVVTNATGAEGIPAVNGRDMLIAESAEELADAVVTLHRDKNLAREISRRSVEMARKHFLYSEIKERYAALVQGTGN